MSSKSLPTRSATKSQITKPIDNSEEVKIMPNDGKERTVQLVLAMKSVTLKNLIDSTERSDKAIPLATISGHSFDKIIEYLIHHMEDPEDDSEDETDEDKDDIQKNNDISAWDQKFLQDMDRPKLFDLLIAANYLDIKNLLDVGCKMAANQIRGKTVAEVQQLWGIECDLTEETVNRLKSETAWAHEN